MSLRLPLGLNDPEIAALIRRQHEMLRDRHVMIASECLPPELILRDGFGLFDMMYNEGWWFKVDPATGEIVFDPDPAEMPAATGFYYYDGNQVNAEAERLADMRLCSAFGLEYGVHAWGTVRPPSGSVANLWTYFGLLEVGDPIVVMDGAAAHLTHVSGASLTSKLWRDAGRYAINPKIGEIDPQSFEDALVAAKPRLVVVDGTALPTAVNFRLLRGIVDRVSKQIGHRILLMGDVAHKAGLIISQVGIFAESDYQPQSWCDVVTFTTHKTLESVNGGCILLPFIDLENDRGWQVTSRATPGSSNYFEPRTELLYERLYRAIFPGLSGKNPVGQSLLKAWSLRRARTSEFVVRMQGVLDRQRVLVESLLAADIPIIGAEHPTSPGGNAHMVLVDLAALGHDKRGAVVRALHDAGFITNFNTLVGVEKQSPMNPPGLRLGTVGVASVPLADWRIVCEHLCMVLKDPSQAAAISGEVMAIARANWPYGDLAIPATHSAPAPDPEVGDEAESGIGAGTWPR